MSFREISDVRSSGDRRTMQGDSISAKLWSEQDFLGSFDSSFRANKNSNALQEFGDLTLVFEDTPENTKASSESTGPRNVEAIAPLKDTTDEQNEKEVAQIGQDKVSRLIPEKKDVPQAFYDAMKKELDVIPAEIQNFVLDTIGTKVIFAKTYRSVDNQYADINARAQGGTRQSFAEAPGAYLPQINTVVVAQYREGAGGILKSDYNNSDLGGVARHEFGHAVDRALTEKLTPYDRDVFSNQTEFVTAFDRDAKRVEEQLKSTNDKDRLSYGERHFLAYYMPDPKGDFKSAGTMKARRELLAELFAVICEEKYNTNGVKISNSRLEHRELLKKEFPETYEVVTKAVQQMMQAGKAKV